MFDLDQALAAFYTDRHCLYEFLTIVRSGNHINFKDEPFDINNRKKIRTFIWYHFITNDHFSKHYIFAYY